MSGEANPKPKKKKINSRTKGHDAERDIAKRLNDIVEVIRTAYRGPLPEDWTPQVQRNQNQSAVGGDDLIGTYQFSIEIKRQEQLSLDKWWEQACASASRQGKVPVVIFKQSRQPWRVLIGGGIAHPGLSMVAPAIWHKCGRVEVKLEDFEELFAKVVKASM